LNLPWRYRTTQEIPPRTQHQGNHQLPMCLCIFYVSLLILISDLPSCLTAKG